MFKTSNDWDIKTLKQTTLKFLDSPEQYQSDIYDIMFYIGFPSIKQEKGSVTMF